MKAFLVAALLLLAAPSAAIAAEPALAGFWYGDNYQPLWKKHVQHLIERRKDGTYVVEFRTYENCRLTHVQVEAGRWRHVGSRYATATEFINMKRLDIPFTDEYAIELLTEDEFRYRHVASGTSFTVKRVDRGFRFSECPT